MHGDFGVLPQNTVCIYVTVRIYLLFVAYPVLHASILDPGPLADGEVG